MNATFVVIECTPELIEKYWAPFMAKYPEYKYIFDGTIEDAKTDYVVITEAWAIPAFDFMALLPDLAKTSRDIILPSPLRLTSEDKCTGCMAGLKESIEKAKVGKLLGSVYIV
jgi:hypothetical protein